MSPDITSLLSLFICDQMAASITGVAFLPEQGQTSGSGETPEPTPGPFAVPIITDAHQVRPPDEVYLVEVHLALQTNPNDTSPEFHSDVVRQMVAVLQAIKLESPKFYDPRNIYINGLYIVGVRPVQSENNYTTVIEVHFACQLRTSLS